MLPAGAGQGRADGLGQPAVRVGGDQGDAGQAAGGSGRRRTPVGFENCATGLDLGFYAARSYSLMRQPRMGRRLIRFREGR